MKTMTVPHWICNHKHCHCDQCYHASPSFFVGPGLTCIHCIHLYGDWGSRWGGQSLGNGRQQISRLNHSWNQEVLTGLHCNVGVFLNLMIFSSNKIKDLESVQTKPKHVQTLALKKWWSTFRTLICRIVQCVNFENHFAMTKLTY